MKLHLKKIFLKTIEYGLIIFITSYLNYNLAYLTALYDVAKEGYYCRVKNPITAFEEAKINDSLYYYWGALKDGGLHVIMEIKKGNKSKIIDKTYGASLNDFKWYIKEKLIDLNGDGRFDLIVPVEIKI
jgi:hypothetical protein